MPPIKDKIMKMATIVPPKIIPPTDEAVSKKPAILDELDITIAPKIMQRNEKRIPPIPRPTTIFAPSASNAAPILPNRRVRIAARMPKIPPIRPIIPPAFAIFNLQILMLNSALGFNHLNSILDEACHI